MKLNSRYFNTLIYNPSTARVIKSSMDELKLIDEILWYKQLPSELHYLIPELYGYSLEKGNVYLEMAYIPYPSLAELYINDELTIDQWDHVLNQIMNLFAIFSSYQGELNSVSLEKMYILKTLERVNQFLEQSEWAKAIRKKGYFRINDSYYLCPTKLLKEYLAEVQNMYSRPVIQLIHGDLCFSNVMYDLSTDSICLIDPRGSFGEPGIYGDSRYDLGKIRHSLSGYEYIVNDKFEIQAFAEGMMLSLPISSVQNQVLVEWDRLLSDRSRDIKMIEALLFLSMLPLHVDRPDRQKAMYGIATQLLYEAFGDN